MGNYFNSFSRALGNSDFITLTYQAFGIFVAILLIFLIAKFLKATINNRIRGIRNFTMDFDSLKQMRKTGLISDVEYEKIRSGLVKRFVEPPSQETPPPGKKLIETPPQKPEPDLEILKNAKLPPDSRKQAKPLSQPIDIDDLLKRGIITPDEYQKLSDINPKKESK